MDGYWQTFGLVAEFLEGQHSQPSPFFDRRRTVSGIVTREGRAAAGEVYDRMPALLTPDAMDAWLDPVRLDRGGQEDMPAALAGSSGAVASTIRQHVVGRQVNSVRAADPSDRCLIGSVAV